MTQSYYRRFASNVLMGLVSQSFRMAVSILLLGYLVHRLSPEEWGLVSLSTSFVTILSLLQLGATAGLSKKLNDAATSADGESYRQYYSTGWIMVIAAAAILLLSIVCAVTVFWSSFRIPADYQQEGKSVFVMLGLATIVMTLSLPFVACMQADHRVDAFEKINIGSNALRGVLSVAFIELFGPYAWPYAIVLLISNLQVLFGVWRWTYHHCVFARWDRRSVTWPVCTSILRLNSLVLFDSVNYALFMQMPMMVFQNTGGLVVAGLYGIGLQLITLVRSVMVAGLNAINPVAISFVASDDRDRLKSLFLIATKFYTVVGGMAWLWSCYLGQPVIRVWVRHDASMLIDSLPWIMGVAAVGLAAMPSAAILVAHERLRATSGLGVLLAVGMTATLVLTLKHECASPLRVGTAILFVFFSLLQLFRLFVALVCLDALTVSHSFGMVLRALLPCCLVHASVSLFEGIVHTGRWQDSAWVACAASVVAVGSSWWLTFSADERQVLAIACRRLKERGD